MPDDDDWGDDPGKTENRSHPDGRSGDDRVFHRESDSRKSGERRDENDRPPPERDDKDD